MTDPVELQELKSWILREIEIRHEAQTKAVELAYRNLEVRLEAMNEFRTQLTAQAGTFATRSSLNVLRDEVARCVSRELFDGAFKQFTADIAEERTARAKVSGGIAVIVGVVGLVAAISGGLIATLLT